MGQADRFCLKRSALSTEREKSSSWWKNRAAPLNACNTIWWIVVVPAFADMSGIIPLDEEEEHEQELYDDVGALDEDIYEVLPGLPACLPALAAHVVYALIFPTVFQSLALLNCFLAHLSLSVQRRICPLWPSRPQKQSCPANQHLHLQVRSITYNAMLLSFLCVQHHNAPGGSVLLQHVLGL